MGNGRSLKEMLDALPPEAEDTLPGQGRFELAEREKQLRTAEDRDALIEEAIRAGGLEKEKETTSDTPFADERAEIQQEFGAEIPSVQAGIIESALRAITPRVSGPDPRTTATEAAAKFIERRPPSALTEGVVRALLPEEVEQHLPGGEALKESRERIALGRFEAFETAADFAPGAALQPLFDSAFRFVAPERAAQAEEVHEAGLQRFKRGLAPGVAKEQTQRAIERQAASITGTGVFTTADDAGIPLETPEGALIRFVGQVVPATVQEGIFALPTVSATREQIGPDGEPVQRAIRGSVLTGEIASDIFDRVEAGEAPREALAAAFEGVGFGSVRFEDALLGTTPEQRGLLAEASLEGRWGVTKAFLRAMHKTEQGRTLGNDFDVAATLAYPGDDAGSQAIRTMAWMSGEAVDILAPWELVFAPAAKGVKAVRAAQQLPKLKVGKLDQGMDQVRAFVNFMRSDTNAVARDLRIMLQERVMGGERIEDLLEVLPDSLKSKVKQLMEEEGVATPPPTLPPEFGPPDLGELPTLPPTPAGPVPFGLGRAAEPLFRGDVVEGPPTVRFPDVAGEAVGEASGKTVSFSPEELVKMQQFAENRAARGTIPMSRAEIRAFMREGRVTEVFTAEEMAEIQRRLRLGSQIDEALKLLDAPDDLAGAQAKIASKKKRAAQTVKRAGKETADLKQVVKREVRAELDGVEGNARVALEEARLKVLSGEHGGLRGFPLLERIIENVRSMDEWWDAKKVAQRALRDIPVSERPHGALLANLRNEGGEALKRLEPDQTPNTPGYRLLDEDKELVFEGDLQATLTRLLTRQHHKDRIMFRDHREVARWRKRTSEGKAGLKPQGSLVGDFDFSTRAEAAIIKGIRDKNPRALIAEERLIEQGAIVRSGAGLPHLEVLASRFRRAIWGEGPPPPPTRSVTQTEASILDMVEDVANAELRSFHGSGQLMEPLAGLVVTRSEWRGINRRLSKLMSDTGFSPKALKFDDDNLVQWTGDQREAATRYFGRAGLGLGDGEVSARQLSDLQAIILKREAGRSADARWAIRGTGDLSNKMVNAIIDTSQQRPGQLAQAGDKAFRGIKAFFTEPALRLLSEPDRVLMRAAGRRLRNVGHEVVDQVKDALKAGASQSEVLHELIAGYRPVPISELRLVESIGRVPGLNDEAAIWALRDRISKEVRGGLDLPDLWSNDVVAVRAAISDYVSLRRSHIDRLGRQVLKAASPDSMDLDFIKSDVLNTDQLIGVWQEFLETSRFDGLLIKNALRDVYQGREVGAKASTQQDQLIKLALFLKSDDIQADIVAQLIEREIGTADPTMRAIVMEVLHKGAKVTTVYPISMVAKAKNILRRLGLEPGMSGATLDDFGGVQMPPALAQELKKAQEAGLQFRPESFQSAAGRWMYGNYKDGLTIWNPAFHVGNFIGIPFMALQQLGVGDTLRTVSNLVTNPDMSFRMASRLSDVPWRGRTSRASKVLTTDAGLHYSYEELELAARRLGVADVFQQALTTRQIGAELDRLTGEWGVLTRSRGFLSGTRDAVALSSEYFERTFRVSVFLDQVKRGQSVEQAAEIARKSQFDYSDLTDTDRAIARWGLVFWAFHRKNMDAFLTQLADNPQRLSAQMRFAMSQRERHGDSDEQLSLLRDSDLARVKLARVTGPGGREFDLSTTSVITPIEGMLMLRDVAKVMAHIPGLFVDPVGTVESLQEVGGQLNPVFAGAIEAATGSSLGQGFRQTVAASNMIPDSLMETGGLRQFLEFAFNPKPTSPRDAKALRQADHSIGTAPKFWAPAEDRRAAWQEFTTLLGGGRFLLQTLPAFVEAAEERDLLSIMQAMGLKVAQVPSQLQAEVQRREPQKAALQHRITLAEQDI